MIIGAVVITLCSAFFFCRCAACETYRYTVSQYILKELADLGFFLEVLILIFFIKTQTNTSMGLLIIVLKILCMFSTDCSCMSTIHL